MTREFLPNGCSFTPPVVSPANWKSQKTSISAPWRIRYRYFDPIACPEGRQFSVRDMNEFKVYADRKSAVEELLQLIKERLLKDQWNPITGREKEELKEYELDPFTLVNDALQYAFDHKVCGQKTKIQLRQVLKHTKLAMRELNFDRLTIGEIRRRHMRFVLDKIGKNKGGWTPTNYNYFRSSLKMLFDVLDEVEAVEVDPIGKIRKMPLEHTIRRTMTLIERKKVTEFLKEKHPNFHRFLHIFFHSGARVSELFRLKGEDVDLENQRYKISIIKGKRRMQVWKTIKDIALPYWRELVPLQTDYVFSRKLIPGPEKIDPIQITRRWRLLVKKKLGIEADFYSLKHSHSTEVVSLLSSRDAAMHNSHSDETMVEKIYDVQRNDRERDRIKTLKNPL